MKQIFVIITILATMTMCKSNEPGTIVEIETNLGNIEVRLYDETPLHHDNFIKLAQSGEFDNKLFHRVIEGFMIQAGQTGNKQKDSIADIKKDDNTIPAEFRFPKYYHKRGALAAARWDDFENPTKASSADQFYIVTGKTVLNLDLKEIEKQRFERLKQNIFAQLQSEGKDTLKALYKQGDKAAMAEFRSNMIAEADKQAETRKNEILFTDEQKKVYDEIGGTPHLDGEYTVFGEVVSGMNVVEKIERVKVNEKDRPFEDIIIKKMTVKE